VAGLAMTAFALLAFGDTGHVGFRVAAYAMGDPAPQFSFLGMSFGLRGLGTAATAITVTLFYVLMVAIWRYRFDKQYGPFEHLLFVSALVRLVLLSLPANQWNSPVPPQPWSTIRNLPLLIQGLVAYLILRDARANKDRAFWWAGIMILASFACYMAVVLFVQQVPLIGMLMIPKTMTYIAYAYCFTPNCTKHIQSSPRRLGAEVTQCNLSYGKRWGVPGARKKKGRTNGASKDVQSRNLGRL
jgi:hypothetical protein